MTASWVIREKATGLAFVETFDERKVKALNTAKYEAVPILQYLEELNAKIKGGPGPAPTCPHGKGFNCRTCYPN